MYPLLVMPLPKLKRTNERNEMNIESYKFWKEIIYKDGKLDIKQILKELDDYFFILEEVPKVYLTVTNGILSKPNYYASTIISFLEDNYYDKSTTREDVKEMIRDSSNMDEIIVSLIEYFEIDMGE